MFSFFYINKAFRFSRQLDVSSLLTTLQFLEVINLNFLIVLGQRKRLIVLDTVFWTARVFSLSLRQVLLICCGWKQCSLTFLTFMPKPILSIITHTLLFSSQTDYLASVCVISR